VMVGVDLHLKRPSVICIFDGIKAIFLESSEEGRDILDFSPSIVVLDAPLSLEIPFRKFERELMRKGFRFLPLSMKSMRELCEKAMKIKEFLEEKGIDVFETHPGSLSKKIIVDIKEKDRRDAFICAFIGYLYKRGLVERVERFLYI